jgi:hypothetical protein
MPPTTDRHVAEKTIRKSEEALTISLIAEAGRVHTAVQARGREFEVVRIEARKKVEPGHSDNKEAPRSEDPKDLV